MNIKDKVNPVGNNKKDVLEWVRVRRPDTAANIEKLWDQDGPALLMAIAYQAGRASVIAEIDGTTITEAAA